MKKRLMALLLVTALLLCFNSCGSGEEDYTLMLLETDISAGVLIESRDTHVSYNGDGLLYSRFLFEGESCERFSKELSVNENWNILPLPETLKVAAYGGVYDDINYTELLAFSDGEDYSLPQVENGYWYFADRHPRSEEMDDASRIFSRSSFNFVFALYDSDTGNLYYYRLDT